MRTMLLYYRRKPYSRMQNPKAGDRWMRRQRYILGRGHRYTTRVLRVSRKSVIIARFENGRMDQLATITRQKYARMAIATLEHGGSFYPAKS